MISGVKRPPAVHAGSRRVKWSQGCREVRRLPFGHTSLEHRIRKDEKSGEGKDAGAISLLAADRERRKFIVWHVDRAGRQCNKRRGSGDAGRRSRVPEMRVETKTAETEGIKQGRDSERVRCVGGRWQRRVFDDLQCV